MSGYKDFDYAQRAIEVGVEGYLLKPVNKAHLEAIVQKMTAQMIITTISEMMLTIWAKRKGSRSVSIVILICSPSR